MSNKKLLAHSYIRFSTPQQAEGHSLQRQTEMAEAYCARRGWTLSQATYRDLGVSAWRGKNALVGNLGEFLSAVKSGAVQPGSALIVESLDRITRQGIDEGYDLIKKILKSGVLLVTLSPEREFDVQATKSLSKGALEIQLILERAAEESERKSDRLSAAWRAKKRKAAEIGEPLTARVPAWLRLVEGDWRVDEQAVQTVRLIFDLAKNGYGIGAIAKKLNKDRVPVIGRAVRGRSERVWARSTVAKILKNKAVIGEYQPYTGRGSERKKDGQAIPDYYPAILAVDDFDKARGAMASRRGKVGRLPKGPINVFSGILRSAQDGGTMHLTNKGKMGGGLILVQAKAALGVPGSKMASFPFASFERAILACLREIKPSEILPEQDGEDKTLALLGKLDEVESEIAKLKARLAQRYSDAVADVLERREDERKELGDEIEAARQEAAEPLAEAWNNYPNLLDALDNAPDQQDARLRLRAVLRRMPEPIEIKNPLLNVVGGGQPDILKDIIDCSKDDGGPARFLYSFAPDLPAADITENSVTGEGDYLKLCRVLWDFKWSYDPHKLGADAKTLWKTWINQHRREKPPANLKPNWSKMEGYSLSLALILFLTHRAANETKSDTITLPSMVGAIRLIEYFKAHAVKTYTVATDTEGDKKVQKALAWIKKHTAKKDTITTRMVQMYGVAGVRTADEARGLLEMMAEQDYGKFIHEVFTLSSKLAR
jgi:DNA invertase Pin-like site-specific DNA recombinase